ncbi:unnamed protein product [Clonostachys rosea]|uniref:SCP domain-containing protein n=1 Tax=Bionectria ochroleuca TaxID=29856 RepID=A0ABY6V1E9_BIOOC|nr:unnamed protein product [Clonostachys rosea]
MQFSTLFVKAALLFSLQTVLANPVPEVSNDITLLDGPVNEVADSEIVLDNIALTADQQKALTMHNKARAERSIPALKWDAGLHASALKYAKKLAARNGGLSHSQSGENLSKAPKSNTPLATGTSYWTNEKKNYHGEIIPQGNFASYGHYTQVMWENTHRVGIASARGTNGYDYIVAHYGPAGNVVGQKPW